MKPHGCLLNRHPLDRRTAPTSSDLRLESVERRSHFNRVKANHALDSSKRDLPSFGERRRSVAIALSP